MKYEGLRVMCTCVETIQRQFAGVKKQTDEMAVCTFDVDDFLDKINTIRKPVLEIIDDINNFVELVRYYFVELNAEDSKMLLVEFVKTRAKMYQVYSKLKKSEYYIGMKEAVKEFRCSIDNYSEMCHDLESFNIKLSENPEYGMLLKELNAIA